MVPEILIEIVEEHNHTMSIKAILEVFEIPRSTFYRWKKAVGSSKELSKNEQLVINKCKETNRAYGYRTITGILKKEGHSINKNTVQRVMQKYNLQCLVKPKRQTHYKGKESLTAQNVLNGDFKATQPLEKLVSDITYLPWGEHSLYLSSIMDLYNGEIIAYTIGPKQDVFFVLDTLEQLPDKIDNCILHTDQGSVYTSRPYQVLVNKKGITMSMSRKGTPSDNAPIEWFHSALKSETFYRFPELKSSTEIITQTVVEFICHYNNKRIQAKLGFMSPNEYRMSQIPA